MFGMAAGNDINELINKIEITPVKDLFKKAQEAVKPKYAQLCDGGVYMGIMNVYLNYMHRGSLKFCGNGWIHALSGVNAPAQNDRVSADPTYCRYHTLKIGDSPGKPPRTIDVEFEFCIFEQLEFYDIFTNPNAQLTYYTKELKNAERYGKIPCVITLTNPRRVDNDENFHGYDFQKIVIPNETEMDARVGQIIKRLAESNKYILEFQTIPMHAKVPGLYMTSTVGLPYEHLTVLLGGHGYKKTVKNGNARYNCKIFTQYKFSRDQWKDKKIIYTALKCLLTKFECMYNYLIDSENTPKSTESFCQSLLDHITKEYVEAVMDGIDYMKENEHDVLSMVETRQICESEFIRHYQCLLTHKWKFENGHFTFKLEDFRSRLSLSESNNGVCDVRAIAYNVVSSTIEPMQRFKNTAADCTIDVDEHGLGAPLSMQPDLETVDAGDKINVFNVHDVFRAFVSIYFQGEQVPNIFQEVLDDAKHLISNMKCYKTSSNIALKRLMKSCEEATSTYDEFYAISELMLDASKHFITLLLHKKPSTDHVNFINYIADICGYLEQTTEDDHDVTVVGIPPTDEYVVHFKFNDMTPRYKESISILTFNRIVAATQLQILASMRRIEHDPRLDISELQFKNYIQLAPAEEGGSDHDSIPPTFDPVCNIDNLMDLLYPASIYDAMYSKIQTQITPPPFSVIRTERDLLDMNRNFFFTLTTAVGILKQRNISRDHNKDDQLKFTNLYLKYEPRELSIDEENPVDFVIAYIKQASHLLLYTLNQNDNIMKEDHIKKWFKLITSSLNYIQSHIKKVFDEDVNCKLNCDFKKLSLNNGEVKQECLHVLRNSYKILRRKSYTNRETESELKDLTAVRIFNRHAKNSRMSKEAFYEAWADIMKSKPETNFSEQTPDTVKDEVFNRLCREDTYYRESVGRVNSKYIDIHSFSCLFLGNLQVNVYIEFVKILYFHLQIIVNLLSSDRHLIPNTFKVEDPMDTEKIEDLNEIDAHIENARVFLASKYNEWWNFGSDDTNFTMAIMEMRSVICDNMYTDKSADSHFIKSVFSFMNDINSRKEFTKNVNYTFIEDGIDVYCRLHNSGQYEIDESSKRVMIGYNLPEKKKKKMEGEFEDLNQGLKKKWGSFPEKIPEDIKSKILREKCNRVTLNFTIHEREVIKIKLHDGTFIDVPLDPKLVCGSYRIDSRPEMRMTLNSGRKYIWNFDGDGVWEKKLEVWFIHRIVKIVEAAGDLHGAMFSNDLSTAMQSLLYVCNHVRNGKNSDITQKLKQMCDSRKLLKFNSEMGSDLLNRELSYKNANIRHLEILRKIAYDRGKKIETAIMNMDIKWDELETHMTSTLRRRYPCLVKIFFEMLKIIQNQSIAPNTTESVILFLDDLCHNDVESNGQRAQNEHKMSSEILDRYTDLTNKCFNPKADRNLALKEVYNEELSNSQLTVLFIHSASSRDSPAQYVQQHTYSLIPRTIANGDKKIESEIDTLNFFIFDCMEIMKDISPNLCLIESDAVVSYGRNEATRVHQLNVEAINTNYHDRKENIRNIYANIRRENLFNCNDVNASDIVDFIQKQWLGYWDNINNLNLTDGNMTDKFTTWKKYVRIFLTQLIDKNAERIFGTFFLYINKKIVQDMIQKLNELTWENLSLFVDDHFKDIYTLLQGGQYTQYSVKPMSFLVKNDKDVIVDIQNYKVLMTYSSSEILSNDVFHINDCGHIKSCHYSKLSKEELNIALVHGKLVHRWLDFIFVMMNVQLYFFDNFEPKGVKASMSNTNISIPIRKYFSQIHTYFEKKWKNEPSKHSLSMSKFASEQKLNIDRLICEEWKLCNAGFKIDDQDIINVYQSYEKTLESGEGGILLKCDLKLLLWTVISKHIYPFVQLTGSPEEQESTKRKILIIFNAAMNNQIALADRIYIFFNEEMRKKYDNGYQWYWKKVIGHMKYILHVCRELYRLPDFTDIQDLTFMYMSEELNRIHMGPIQYKSVCQ